MLDDLTQFLLSNNDQHECRQLHINILDFAPLIDQLVIATVIAVVLTVAVWVTPFVPSVPFSVPTP